MDFGYALREMKAGRKVTGGELQEGAWLALMSGRKLPPFSSQATGAKVHDTTARLIGVDTPLDSQPYFARWTPDGRWHPGWSPSQADMLAENWRVVE